jgi:uracil-DNA glycosylase family 4
MLSCKECYIHKQSRVGYECTNVLKGNGSGTARVMVVFESLFYSDVKEHKIFTDLRYRRVIKDYFEGIGISINDIYFTSLIKCYLSDAKKKPTKVAINKCTGLYLNKEIEDIKPRIILTVGLAATKFFIPEVANLRQAVGNYFYSNIYNCYCLPLFSFQYLSNLSSYAPQVKGTHKAFQKVKYLLTKQKKDNFDFSYSSDYAKLKTLDKVVSVDFETAGTNYLKDDVVTVGISDLKQNLVFDTDEIDWTKLTPELTKRKIVGQNFIYDLLFAKRLNLNLDQSFAGDTRVMQFLINRMGATSLGYMTQVYFGYGYKDEGDITKILEWSKEERKLRCVRDNYFQIRLFYKLYPIVKKMGSINAFKILSGILPVLADMEHKGILINEKRLNELMIDFNEKKEQAKAAFIKRLKLKEDFNPNSTKQLNEVLYGVLGLPVKIKTTEGNPSANKKAIDIAAKSKPVLGKLLEYREYKGELEKLALYKKHILSDGRIHSKFNTFSPKSSRAMSAKPNIQNVKRGSAVKEIFIAPPGYSYLYYDFASLEFRLWAIISKDDKAIQFIKDGGDIHKYIASIYYKKPEKDITKQERAGIKDVVYGSIYGADPEGVAYNKGIDVKFAEQVQRLFFQLCRKGYFWIRETEQRIEKEKQVSTLFGTTKFIQDLELAKDRQRKHLIDSAKNFIVQSTGGELGFITMIKIHKAFLTKGLDAHFVHNIHDGNIIEIKDSQVKEGLAIVKKYGTNPVPLSAPIEVDIKVGKSWASLEDVE